MQRHTGLTVEDASYPKKRPTKLQAINDCKFLRIISS
jgi:hypothetical protein